MKNRFTAIIERMLAKLAQKRLRASETQVIAVTGSSGKTTTKYAIGHLLRKLFKDQVLTGEGNLNNESGVPLVILGFTESVRWWQLPEILIVSFFRVYFGHKLPKYLVLEYAADKPNDLKYLTKIAQPAVAVITNIGQAHLANYRDISELRKEKLTLADEVQVNGAIVLNSDDQVLKQYKPKTSATLIHYGLNSGADLLATKVTVETNKTTFLLKYNGIEYSVEIRARGRHYVYAALAALSVALWLNARIEDAINSLKTFDSLSGHGKLRLGYQDRVIIDDSYNANPESMLAALQLLEDIKGKRKIAIIGDMLELGSDSLDQHKKVLRRAFEVADVVIGIGPQMNYLKPDYGYESVEEAVLRVEALLKSEDVVLVKASHGIHLDKIIGKLIP